MGVEHRELVPKQRASRKGHATDKMSGNASASVRGNAPPSQAVGSGVLTDQDRGLENFSQTRVQTVPGTTPFRHDSLSHAIVHTMAHTFGWPGDGFYPSFELSGPDPKTKNPEQAVAFWLSTNAQQILDSAQVFNVSEIAIAGIIAWEALVNPQGQSFSSVGPGKIHTVAEDGHLTWPEAVEAAGELPKLTPYLREEQLKTARGSIQYIAAILDFISRVADHYGFNVRGNPEILGFAYHGFWPDRWIAHMSSKVPGSRFVIQPGTIGAWIPPHMNFLVAALHTRY